MKKIWLIISREYLNKVKKRAFIVTTFLVPVLFVAATFGIAYISNSSAQQMTIAVKDDSGLFGNKVRGMDNDNLSFTYFGQDAASRDEMISTYLSEGYNGLIYIPQLDSGHFSHLSYWPQISYYSNQSLGRTNKSYLESELSEVLHTELIKETGIDRDILKKLETDAEIQPIIRDQEESRSKTDIASAIGYMIGFIIYIYLFAYGAMVMRSVMEEKTNRIVEVIITAVKPFQLMMGKVIGIGAVGLTQLLIWGILFNALYFVLALVIGPDVSTMQGGVAASASGVDQEQMQEAVSQIMIAMGQVNWLRLGISFLFYFIFGYIFYASQFAAIGAAATDDADVQTLMFPVSIPIIISIVIMISTIEQPNSGMAVWASMIPFTSPVVMVSRLPFEISWWQQFLSMMILMGSAIGMVWIAGRVYRIGILVQGQKVSFGKIWKWLISSQ